VRESLFTVPPNDERFPMMGGEAVFELKGWDVEGLKRTLETRFFPKNLVSGVSGFTPGVFTRLHLDLHLPGNLFPEARARLEQYLRSAYVPYSLRREGVGYRFDLPAKGLKKKVLFGGFLEVREDGFFAGLEVGPKFDLMELLQGFGKGRLFRFARVKVVRLEW
jgi:hypothetical protein